MNKATAIRDAFETTASHHSRIKTLIAAAFGREALNKATQVIVPFNDVGEGVPFYCLHSVTGSATDFRDLALMLGPKQKFFGIQTPSAQRTAAFASSIEAMSASYVNALMKFQPEGPLVLGGHSVGAIIAYEMAQRLREEGREVSLLVILDSELYNTGVGITARHPLYWAQFVGNLPHWIRDEVLTDFSLRRMGRRTKNKIRAIRKSILARLCGDEITSGHAAEGFIDPKGFPPERMQYIKALFQRQLEYKPAPYDGPVVVYAAKTQSFFHMRQIEPIWKAFARQVDIVYLEGTHLAIIHPPKGLALADDLKKRIEAINAFFEARAKQTISSQKRSGRTR